jgi:hypothetical protein
MEDITSIFGMERAFYRAFSEGEAIPVTDRGGP